MRYRVFIFFFLLIVIFCSSLPAKNTGNVAIKKEHPQSEISIKGIVKDKISKMPVKKAFLKVTNHFNFLVTETETDEFGEFRLNLPEGEYKIEIKASGYLPVINKIKPHLLKRNYFGEAIYAAYVIKNQKDNNKPRTEEASHTPSITTYTEKPKEVIINTTIPVQDTLHKIKIRGMLKDSISLLPVSHAVILLSDTEGKNYFHETETDHTGNFTLFTSSGNYKIEIDAPGYHPAHKYFETQNGINLETLYLTQDNQFNLIKGIEVVAQKARIKINGDTLQYDASSFTYRNGALLKDLIKNIPGISMKGDGSLTANGQQIQKIKVDGKEFFGNDIQMALQNLPADIVSKIELYKEPTQISKVTGFRNEEEEQILNLKIKEEYKRNLFGEAQAGYGSNDRYNYKGMINYLGNENQFSAITNLNNVNGDLEEVESFSEDVGEITSKTIGANAVHEKSKNFKIAANIRHSDDSNELKTTDHTEYFIPEETRYSNSTSSDKKEQQNTAFGINLSYEPKSRFSLHFRISGEHENTKGENNTETFSFSGQSETIREFSNSLSKGKNNELNSSLTLGWKLNEEGNRTVGISLNGNYNKEEDNTLRKSITQYTSNEEEIDLDHKIIQNNTKSNAGFTISYTEPLNKKNALLFSYSFQNLDLKKHNQTLNKDLQGNFTQTDSTYTRFSDIKSQNQTFALTYQSVHDKYQYTLGVNAEPFSSENSISIGKHFLQSVKQTDVNYSSNLRFQYKPSNNRIFTFNYLGRLVKPNIDQLTTDTLTLSPTSKTYGNPDLKPAFNNNLTIQFQKTNLRTGRYLSILGGLNFTANQPASYTLMDAQGNQESSYKNVNGNWGANISTLHNIPVKNTDMSLDMSMNSSYSNYVGFMNNTQNSTHNYTINGELSLNMDFDFLETRLQSSYTYNTTTNNQPNQTDLKTSVFLINNLMLIKLPLDIELYNYLGYTYRTGYKSDSKKDEIIWNVSLSKQILKNKGELRLQIYDLLNSRNTIMRTTNSNFTTEVQTNVITRYFMFSFIYKFNFSK